MSNIPGVGTLKQITKGRTPDKRKKRKDSEPPEEENALSPPKRTKPSLTKSKSAPSIQGVPTLYSFWSPKQASSPPHATSDSTRSSATQTGNEVVQIIDSDEDEPFTTPEKPNRQQSEEVLCQSQTLSLATEPGGASPPQPCTDHLFDTSISGSAETGLPIIKSYYLKNFFLVVDFVYERHRHLLLDQEVQFINMFKSLPEPCQRLFIRLYSRKATWFQVSKLNYSAEIPEMANAIELLVDANCLEEATTLLDIVEVISVADLKSVVKPKPGSNVNRDTLITEAKKLASQRTLSGSSSILPKRFGKFIKVKANAKELFKRIHRLFFLNQQEDQELLTMIQLGRVKFAQYIIPGVESYPPMPSPPIEASQESPEPAPKRVWTSPDQLQQNIKVLCQLESKSVFSSREALDDYNDTLQLAVDFATLLGEELEGHSASGSETVGSALPGSGTLAPPKYSKVPKLSEEQINHAISMVQESVAKFTASLQNATQTLPENYFVRRFHSMWLQCCMIWIGVGLLEKQRLYQLAVDYLRLLLGQSYVCTGWRGDWWIRLAFDLAHLKQTDEAIAAIMQGLSDEHIRPQHRLGLDSKLEIVSKQKKRESGELKKMKRRSGSLNLGAGSEAAMAIDLEQPQITMRTILQGTQRVIQARPLIRSTSTGKSKFFGFFENEVGVEQLALEFYKVKMGFDGAHLEGSIYSTLYGLIMWDIIFDATIPFVFQTPFQDCPLDFSSEAFYQSRREKIEERLELITNDPEFVEAQLQRVWVHHGCSCRGVNWALLPQEQLIAIAQCVGGPVLAAIFRRFAIDFRYSCSGLPDLTLWNISEKKAKLVEVKSPRDKLSDKQRIWIDILEKAGADIEVLWVREKVRDGEIDDSADVCFDVPSADEPNRSDV